MINWFNNNWCLIPGIILLIFSMIFIKRKVWWWTSFDDEIPIKSLILMILGFLLYFIGWWYKLEYLTK